LISEEGREYKRTVAILGCACDPMTGPVSLTYFVYRPRKVGDLDNYLKGLLDALKGIAFIDDAQVVELHGFLYDDKTNPRVDVVIEEATA
jgi:Holliday junction resolvase RusA-like endonuclease